MARKQSAISRRMLFTWFMLGGFILLFTPKNLTNKFQFAFVRAFGWPLGIGRSITLAADTQTATDFVSRREYNQLRNHLANIIEQRNLAQKDIEKLSKLRAKPTWERMNFVLADIITASEGTLNELIINRGTEDGLADKQFVLGDNSIIGTISDVSAHRAKVKLFTNPASKIPVRIEQSNVVRVMQGAGDNCAKIQLLQINQKVKKDNIVLADKQPGFLDVPMIIGKVTECKRDDKAPSLWDITVEPVCDMQRLDYVAVIAMNP
jgi:rod shape-determining protein MreC